MANRILKQSICSSESIDGLDWFEEVFFYRLIVNVDDYGVLDARPKILKSALFPLRDVKLAQIEKVVKRLAEAGLIHLYTVEGKPYLSLPTWTDHQRVRTSKHKYPTPDMADKMSNCDSSPQSAASCGELRRVAANCGELPQSAESCGLTRAREESESQSETEAQTETESVIDCTELPDASTAPQELAAEPEADVSALILNDGSEWRPLAKDVEDWKRLYPGVDVPREFSRMRQWCIDNPRRRKTAHGIRRFARGWLDREQNRGWRNRAAPEHQQEPRGADAYYAMAEEASG